MKNKIKIVLVILISSLINIRCVNNEEDDFMPISVFEIGQGSLSGNGIEGIVASDLVISDSTAWNTLINQMNLYNEETSNFAEVDINFTDYLVIASFLDVKPNGWELDISNVTETTDTILVTKTDQGLDLPVISQPYHIVKIPITNKQIVFL